MSSTPTAEPMRVDCADCDWTGTTGNEMWDHAWSPLEHRVFNPQDRTVRTLVLDEVRWFGPDAAEAIRT